MNKTIHRILALFSGRNVHTPSASGPSLVAGLGLLALCVSAQAQVSESYTFTTNRALPDGNAAGLADVRTLDSAITSVASVTAHLKIAGEFNGDVYAYLAHADGFCVLLNRVGRTTKNGAGYADHGFDVSFTLDAENGDIHQYQDITALKPGQPLTGFWQTDGRSADPAEVMEASPRENSLKNFLGLNAAGDWTLYLVDLETGGTNQLTEWGLEISGIATPGLVWTNPATITYGTALGIDQLNATATYAGTNVPGKWVYSPDFGTVLNAGAGQSLSVTFTPTDSDSFQPINGSVLLEVSPAPLTIVANSASKAYGAALPEMVASYEGFVNGDDTNQLTALAKLTTTATALSDVGVYPITASGARSENYSFQYVSGSLTITQALTVARIVSSTEQAAPGAKVAFTAHIAAVAPGAGTPSGKVKFLIDGTEASTEALSDGAATFTIDQLSHGVHVVAIEYGGDLNFVGTTATLENKQTINSAPIAGDDKVERYATQGVKVRLSALLANDGDADNDSLQVKVDASSLKGGQVTVSGEWVTYTPAPGFTEEDAFTYTLTDEFGGRAVGTVAVLIKNDQEPSQTLTIAALGDGAVLIRGNGIPGRTYFLEYSDTVAPYKWQEMAGAKLVTNANGVFEWIDREVKGSRFYRSVYR